MIQEHIKKLENIANNIQSEKESFWRVGTDINIPIHILDIIHDQFELLSITIEKTKLYY